MGVDIELPVDIGDTIIVCTCCDNISSYRKYGQSSCPYLAAGLCDGVNCHPSNEKELETVVKSIHNEGNGWFFRATALDIDLPLDKYGKLFWKNTKNSENPFIKKRKTIDNLLELC